MIYIVQYLCPERHAILGAIYDEAGEQTYETVCQDIKTKLRELGLREHCGICGSDHLHFEKGKTPFNTMEEAMPDIATCMIKQLITRALLEHTGETADARERVRNN